MQACSTIGCTLAMAQALSRSTSQCDRVDALMSGTNIFIVCWAFRHREPSMGGIHTSPGFPTSQEYPWKWQDFAGPRWTLTTRVCFLRVSTRTEHAQRLGALSGCPSNRVSGSQMDCFPSPCAWLSRARTTTEAPPSVSSISDHRSEPGSVPGRRSEFPCSDFQPLCR